MADETESPSPEPARRRFLRGGIAAAGAGVAVAMLGQHRAAADDGDSLLAGRSTSAGSTTTLSMTGAANQPGLTVQKTQGGPQLRLVPTAYDANLSQPGELQVTTAGPILARVYSDNGVPYDDYVATGRDVDQLSSYQTVPPRRLVDTRKGLDGIQQHSPGAFDDKHRLTPRGWFEVILEYISYESPIEAAFVNLTAVEPVTGGYLTAYPGDPRPGVSSVNFVPGQTIANAMFVATSYSEEAYVFRIWTNAVTHVVVDLSGYSLLGPNGVYTGQRVGAKQEPRRSPARRIVRARQLRRR